MIKQRRNVKPHNTVYGRAEVQQTLIPFRSAPALKYFLVICLQWYKSETSPNNVPSFPFWHYIMTPEGDE